MTLRRRQILSGKLYLEAADRIPTTYYFLFIISFFSRPQMSGGEEGEAGDTSCECCASCGKAEIDDIKLVPCDGCDLVKYCGDDCRENHKPEHEEECKKRAAELRDELLFKQPENTHRGDCPICSLPLPFDNHKSGMYPCCSKTICTGCVYANYIRFSGQMSCPFCREPAPETDEEIDKQNMKRIDANDPLAIHQQGAAQYMKGDYHGAFDYYTKAAGLGHADAHFRLALLYRDGEGVEKDKGKEIHHMEEAAIGGHPNARHNLGAHEWNNNDNAERAVKHFIIAATQGNDLSIKMLMDIFKCELISKEVLAATLRAHKAAVDASKSPQREEAELYYRNKVI